MSFCEVGGLLKAVEIIFNVVAEVIADLHQQAAHDLRFGRRKFFPAVDQLFIRFTECPFITREGSEFRTPVMGGRQVVAPEPSSALISHFELEHRM